jgi:hypothetical protein
MAWNCRLQVHNYDVLRSKFGEILRWSEVGDGVMSRRIPRMFASVALIATLQLGVGVTVLANTARADDCLATPNSAAPQGSHWYYRLDLATKRKCWYVRALGQPAQQAAAPAKRGPGTSLHSTPAPSSPNPPPEGPGVSVSSGEAAAPPPLTEMPGATPHTAPAISAATDNTASSIPDKPAPAASTRSATSADASAPAQDVPPAISATTDQSVQQSPQEENTGSIPNAPPPQASMSSETGDRAVAPAPFTEIVSSATIDRPAQQSEQKENTASIQDPSAAPASTPSETSAPAAPPPAVVWAPFVKAVPTDATAATASENAERKTARRGEPTMDTEMPMGMFLALALGLTVIGIASRVVIKMARRAPVITDRLELDPYDDPEFYRKLREGVALNKPQ